MINRILLIFILLQVVHISKIQSISKDDAIPSYDTTYTINDTIYRQIYLNEGIKETYILYRYDKDSIEIDKHIWIIK